MRMMEWGPEGNKQHSGLNAGRDSMERHLRGEARGRATASADGCRTMRSTHKQGHLLPYASSAEKRRLKRPFAICFYSLL